MAAPTSQRLSFTQLVLDMGLADKKALLKAKKLIKEREAEGRKLTVARACVELEILTEKQAKRVQLELKRLKEGLASSQELTAATEEDAAVAAKAEAKRQAAKKKQKEAKAEAAKAEAAKDEAPEGEKPKKAGKAGKAKGKPAKDEAAKDAAAKDEAAEDEAPEAKGKKGAKKGKAEPKDEAEPKDAAKPKGKAKLGKEIQLDSQRQARATPGAKRALGSGAARRGVGAARKQSGEGPAPGAKKSNTPYIALGGAVVVLLVIAGMVALSDGEKKPTDQAGVQPTPDVVTPPAEEPIEPTPDVGPIQSPPPEQPSDDRTQWTPAQKLREAERQIDRLALDADDQAAKGRFAKAIELLEEFPQDLRDQEPWKEIGARDLAKYKKLLPVQERFEAALAKAADDPEPLAAMVLEMLGPNYEFAGEGFLREYKARAEEALGEDAYAELEDKADELAFAHRLDEIVDEVDAGPGDGAHEIMTAQAAEVRLRGTPERHEQFLAAVPAARAQLEKAKQILADRAAAEKKRLEEQEKQALRAAKKTKLLTDDGKSCELTGFTDHGFTVKVGRDEITYGWGNCPPKLGHAVKLLGIDAKSAEEVYQLGIWALTRAAFDLAEADFKQAVRLDSSYQAKIPDIEQLKHFTKLFRGRHSVGAPGEATQVKWEFKADRPQELRDFKAMHEQMQVELVGGQLKISAPQGFLITAAEVRGSWQREAKLTVVPASNNPPPIVVFRSEGGAYQVRLGQKTELYAGLLGDGEALASSDARAMPGSRAEVGVKVAGEKATVTVKLDGAQAFSHEVPFQGELVFSIGARGAGEARFAGVEVTGILADGWSERTLASAPNLITRALREAERQRESASGGSAGVPVAYLKTSAEDAVALEGIPPETIAIVNEGRQLLETGNSWGAFQKFREAAEKNIEFHAANYLYAASQTRSDPQGALIRLQRCVDGVQDFYEAMVAKAEALFWLGRFEQARKTLDEAMALRPDYAPAHQTDANLSVAELDYTTALEKIKLAQVLAPGDPVIEMYFGQVTALAEGPAWSNRARFTNDFYRLDTDMVAFGDKFLKQLTLMRTALEESFPILINPEAPKRQASLLVFGEAEGYYSYSERTGVGRAEDSLGHFNLWSGQLLLFLEREPVDWNAFHVIFHEGTHQWCYSQGLALPYWFNEGVAEYMGGTQLAMDGSRIIAKGKISSFLKQRIQGLIANWDEREKTWFDIMTQSPEQFYSGNQGLKYAQGWTIVHFIMESGDETLKKTLWKYLQYFVDAAKGDPGDNKETRGGSKLEHIYGDTFHQLDMRDVEARWVKWVEKLAKECGIDWTAPEEKE